MGKILTLEMKKGTVDLEHGLSNQVLNLFAQAVIVANYEYMHKRSFLADTISKMRESSPVLYEVFTFWQPFINSSMNWFTEAFKYTPLGLITSLVQMSKVEKTIARLDAKRARGEITTDTRATEYLTRRDVGKGIIGMAFSIFGMLLASFGLIRIEEDDDKFYIFAGDIKFDITNIFGSSSVLVGASLAQSWVESDSDYGFEGYYKYGHITII